MRQGGPLESPPLKVRFGASDTRRDRCTLQTSKSVRGVPPGHGSPKSEVWIRSRRGWHLQSWGAGPAAPAPATPPAGSPPAATPCPGPHRSPGVRRGVRVAAPAAAAAACRSALVSNSLHGYSLYGGGGGGAGRSSSGSRRPPARLQRPPAPSARPPRSRAALAGRGVAPGNGYQAARPAPPTARPWPPLTASGRAGALPIGSCSACQR